ncbi:hypothetical protein M408DRAFT_27463 [Serendipita vermifera MAFF 305830]|uniref:GAG-pre-integrase domain-containing protein n=1 Tax=Serendipita vermifera MAFF 305830 TaxID=933852 RepID=A0A0C3AVJ2_SERVB|nr:hypothetical protein M408DRAFT_27463 [Serendipita vermifera MAFF 305830]
MPAIHVPQQQQALTAGLYPHDLYLWHCRFGHRRIAAVERAIKHSLLGVKLDTSTSSPSICVPCVAGKQHRDPFPSSEHKTSCPMEIIYCDLRGAFNTHNHKSYWADLYSRVLLGTKLSSELLTEYKAFESLGKACFDVIVVGAQYQQTTRNTPQQNGISEHANRDTGEPAALTMLRRLALSINDLIVL